MALIMNIVPRGSYDSKLKELNSSGRSSRNYGSINGDHFSSESDEYGSYVSNNNKSLDSFNNKTMETSSSNHQDAICSTNNRLSFDDGAINESIECTIESCDGGVGGVKSSGSAKKKSAPYLKLIGRNNSIESLLRPLSRRSSMASIASMASLCSQDDSPSTPPISSIICASRSSALPPLDSTLNCTSSRSTTPNGASSPRSSTLSPDTDSFDSFRRISDEWFQFIQRANQTNEPANLTNEPANLTNEPADLTDQHANRAKVDSQSNKNEVLLMTSRKSAPTKCGTRFREEIKMVISPENAESGEPNLRVKDATVDSVDSEESDSEMSSADSSPRLLAKSDKGKNCRENLLTSGEYDDSSFSASSPNTSVSNGNNYCSSTNLSSQSGLESPFIPRNDEEDTFLTNVSTSSEFSSTTELINPTGDVTPTNPITPTMTKRVSASEQTEPFTPTNRCSVEEIGMTSSLSSADVVIKEVADKLKTPSASSLSLEQSTAPTPESAEITPPAAGLAKVTNFFRELGKGPKGGSRKYRDKPTREEEEEEKEEAEDKSVRSGIPNLVFSRSKERDAEFEIISRVIAGSREDDKSENDNDSNNNNNNDSTTNNNNNKKPGSSSASSGRGTRSASPTDLPSPSNVSPYSSRPSVWEVEELPPRPTVIRGESFVLQRRVRVDEYFRMKEQWKAFTPGQESRFSALKDRKALIEKDVTRTDRTHAFFEGENNPNLAVLSDILTTYLMYNFDLGYVQGMSDLLAPVLVVMENEVDAFWCFAGFMELIGRNFEMDQSTMKKQMSQLHAIISFVDLDLTQYLDEHDAGNFYFCFRWLLILFKREFCFPDIMRLWEVIWTEHPCRNFQLLICVALLDTEKSQMTENEFGFTEILKHVNDLSGSIDVEAILKKAEAIFLQIAGCRAPPKQVASILGLEAMLYRGSGSSGCSRAGAGEKGGGGRSVSRNDAEASKVVNDASDDQRSRVTTTTETMTSTPTPEPLTKTTPETMSTSAAATSTPTLASSAPVDDAVSDDTIPSQNSPSVKSEGTSPTSKPQTINEVTEAA